MFKDEENTECQEINMKEKTKGQVTSSTTVISPKKDSKLSLEDYTMKL